MKNLYYKYLVIFITGSVVVSIVILNYMLKNDWIRITDNRLAKKLAIRSEPSDWLLKPVYKSPEEEENSLLDGYIVYTNSCQIADVNIWHDSILPYVKKHTKSLSCDKTLERPDLTFVEGDMLFVNSSNIEIYGELDFCEWVEIIRVPNSDSAYTLGRKRYVFKEKIVVKKEFIKVSCYSMNQSLIYHNLYAFTPVDPGFRHVKESLFVKHKRRGFLETLDILMVGIDSISRINFHRQFPKTANVLLEKLKAYEMFGYNKVRDNTFVNLVPMFLGKYVEETGWDEINAHNHTFDKYQYSWKKFASAGYHTLFAEDAPKIAIWNFEKPGFVYTPADYYLRPFSLAMASTSRMWHNDNHCFGERLETDITLDYLHSFIKNRESSPYFAFTFLTRPTYDSINQNTDDSHARFLNSLIDGNYLDNAIVIYFSDHGARRGDILSTYIGKLEERLPALFVSVPEWFRRKYPLIARNLEINQHRLTTPFDINALLDDVLHFTGEVRSNMKPSDRSISLFNRVPSERSCLSASIEDHWCTCLQRTKIDIDDDMVRAGALKVVEHINNITSSLRSKCVEYSLKTVTDALVSAPNGKLLTFKASINDVIGRKEYYGKSATGHIALYLITLIVEPNDGVFQATVRYDSSANEFSVTSELSRTSLYGDSSWCVDDHNMKKFCFCSKLRS